MAKQAKFTTESLIDLNIHDTGGAHVPPNGFLKEREPKVADKPPKDKYDVFRGVPDLTTNTDPVEIPFLSMRTYSNAKTHEIFLQGEAWESESGFNYYGRGTAIKFVCVKGGINWAMYKGPAQWSEDRVATDGDKVLSHLVLKLIYCEGPKFEGDKTPLDFYRN